MNNVKRKSVVPWLELPFPWFENTTEKSSTPLSVVTSHEGSEDEHEEGIRNELGNRKSHGDLKGMKKSEFKAFHFHNVSRNCLEVKLPRIPKSDIRRDYPFMLINVLNTMDTLLLRDFLSSFTHSKTILKRRIMSQRLPACETQSISFYGTEDIFYFIFVMGLLGPDRVFQLNNCSIVTRSTTYRTEIIIECTVDVHFLYDASAAQIAEFLTSTNASRGLNCSPKQLLSSCQQVEETLQRRFTLFPLPLKYTGARKITLVIDNIYQQEELDAILIEVPYDTKFL